MHAAFQVVSLTRSGGRRCSARTASRLCGVLLLLGLVGLPRVGLAECQYYNRNHQAGVVTFNAGTITVTISQNPSTTTPIYTSNTNAVPPGTPLYLTCYGSTPSGIVNQVAGPPSGSDDTLFPTGIPGISYRILHPDTTNFLSSYPNYAINGYGNISFSVASNLALYYVGPYLPSNDSTINGELAVWNVDVCSSQNFYNCYFGTASSSPQPVEIFKLNATIHILVPTCNIATGSVNTTVTLPGVNQTAFTGPGSTAGRTPFSLQLTNCANNLGVLITLNSNNAQPGATGVIAPTSGSGYASGIGVQILESDGTTPVTFGTAINTGTTSGSNSNYAINLYARYYQTGQTVTGGSVKGIATYTVEYQ